MVETTDSNAELADSTNNSVIVSQLHQLNMFILLNPLELANGNVYSSETTGIAQWKWLEYWNWPTPNRPYQYGL